MDALTVPAAQAVLADNFASWVQDLGLSVESVGSGEAVLRMPYSERLVRVGGTLCGQALMSAADTAMVIALWRAATDSGYLLRDPTAPKGWDRHVLNSPDPSTTLLHSNESHQTPSCMSTGSAK